MPDGLELFAFGTLGETPHVGVDGCGDCLELFDFFGNVVLARTMYCEYESSKGRERRCNRSLGRRESNENTEQ